MNQFIISQNRQKIIVLANYNFYNQPKLIKSDCFGEL